MVINKPQREVPVYACVCYAIRDKEIDALIQSGHTTVRSVGQACRAGTCCGACAPWIRERIAEQTQSGCDEMPQTVEHGLAAK